MALDEPKDTDVVLTACDYKFILEKELFARIEPVNIDSSPETFVISGRIGPEDVPIVRRRKGVAAILNQFQK